MTQRTETEQNIEQVAGVIYELAMVTGELDSDEAIQGYNREGWDFEVRYDTHEYLSSRDCTRVEGLVLSPQNLDRAVRLATVWLNP
jgi:hypothetical protein